MRLFKSIFRNGLIADFLYFYGLGAVCLLFLFEVKVSISLILQLLAVLIILAMLAYRFILSKSGHKATIYIAGIMPVALLIDLLLFSTGGISSPFLISSYLLTIAVSFLISPQIGLSYIISTIFLLFLHTYLDPSAEEFVKKAPFAALLYFLSYIALVPFSYFLAREYKIKDDWAKILEQQISMFKSEEEQFLKNIVESVIVIDPKYKILYSNEQAKSLLKDTERIGGQKIYNLLTFKNQNNEDANEESIFTKAFSSKEPETLDNVNILSRSGEYVKAKIIMVPIVQYGKIVALSLIIKLYSEISENLPNDPITS